MEKLYDKIVPILMVVFFSTPVLACPDLSGDRINCHLT